jgi:hypothetical protein
MRKIEVRIKKKVGISIDGKRERRMRIKGMRGSK